LSKESLDALNKESEQFETEAMDKKIQEHYLEMLAEFEAKV